MSRFTLRDLFWLTLVVAMGVGWWLDRGMLSRAIGDLARYARQEHTEVVYWEGTQIHVRPK